MSTANFNNLDENPYASFGMVAAEASESERTSFIRRTYMHLGLAIYALVGLELALFNVVPREKLEGMIGWMFSGWNYMIFFGAFMLVSYVAEKWARSDTSSAMQYAGLGIYTVAQSIFLLPLLYYAQTKTAPISIGGMDIPVIAVAAGITLLMFGGLTAIVFITGKDFSFLRTGLMLAGIGVFGLIICSIVMGFSLGIFFSFAMVAFACGYILYDTSNVLHHYRTTQHVAASLALFSSVVLLFWYVLRIVIALSGRD